MKTIKVLLSLGSVVAASKLAHMASSLRFEDVLNSMGLARRRSRLRDGLILLGAGAAAGAATALLFAPASGRQTRARLGKEFSKVGEAATEAVRETAASARAFGHSGNDVPRGMNEAT